MATEETGCVSCVQAKRRSPGTKLPEKDICGWCFLAPKNELVEYIESMPAEEQKVTEELLTIEVINLCRNCGHGEVTHEVFAGGVCTAPECSCSDFIR